MRREIQRRNGQTAWKARKERKRKMEKFQLLDNGAKELELFLRPEGSSVEQKWAEERGAKYGCGMDQHVEVVGVF